MFDIFLITIAILGLIIATISDIKTREIPDWLNYSLIITAIAARLIYSILSQDFQPLAYIALAFTVVFIFSNILYYTKQWGGGDAKMLIALSVIFAVKPSYISESSFPFLIILITNILFIGAVYGLVYGIVLGIKHKEKFKKEIISLIKQKRTIILAKLSLILSIIWIIFVAISKIQLIKFFFAILALASPLYYLLWLSAKAIEKATMYKRISIEKARIGDWLVENIIIEKELILKSKPEGLSKGDIQTLKKNKIKSILIKEGIPFIPPFLIATILTLLRSKLLFLIP